jgi:hypothetical protein
MLRYDSSKRPTANQILQHPYFTKYMVNENGVLVTPPNGEMINKNNNKENEKVESFE